MRSVNADMKLPGTVILVLCSCWRFSEGVVTITPVNGTTRSVGQNFTFTCTTSIPGNEVFFDPSDRLIPNPPSGGSTVEFTVTNLNSSDNGRQFSCRDIDGIEAITLEVLFPPNYINSTGDQEISIGNGFSVIFNLEAQPIMGDNFTYTWTKNGVPFTSSSNVAITATSLSITSAECSDNGLYSVTATNPLGSDSVSFRLTVLCPPTFEAGSGIIPFSVIAGQNFSINCRVNESYPLNPTITLTGPGITMPDVTTNPIIREISRDQAGTYDYVCSANNTRATTALTYRVTVTMSSTTSSTGSPAVITTPTAAAPNFSPSLGLIIGVVVGVSVLACVISILVPLLICCCLGVACFASIGCLAKKKEEVELAKL